MDSGPLLVAYVSGHGFGHSTRTIETLRALHDLQPDLRVDIRTTAPRELYAEALPFEFKHTPIALDVGVVQADSLTVDPVASLRSYAAIAAAKGVLVDREVRALDGARPSLVIGDIPAIAFDIAAELQVPSVAIANFSWDWIYEDYVGELPDFADVIGDLRQSYGRADLLMRLPMTCPMPAFRKCLDVPLVARRSGRDSTAIRDVLGIPKAAQVILLSFGGMGLELAALPEAVGDRLYVLTDSVRADSLPAGYMSFPNSRLFALGVRYEDLVAAVDVVMTKPGYGVVSECHANRSALVYTSRGRFAEYDVLVEYVEKHLACAFLSNEKLRAGQWDEAIDRALARSWPDETVAIDGAQLIANHLQRYFAASPQG